jgi:hypothetical protein
MLSSILQQCNARLPTYPCCQENHECNCLKSLSHDYWNRPDTYNCNKKMDTYVLRYGLSYASEIYHYLEASNFQNKINLNEPLIVKSLGCGFSPDYYAIKKYFEGCNTQMPTPINYTGLDSSSCWDLSRPDNNECHYQECDLTLPFDISGADIVFISKVFSTLYRNNNYINFLNNLESAISTLHPGAIIVFIDINNNTMGRDVFHNNVKKYLPISSKYYFDREENSYVGYEWERINNTNIMFDSPNNLNVMPLQHAGKTVIFEYRK